MKSKLYAILAIICFLLSSALFVLCSGTVLAFIALVMLGLTAVFTSLYFESRPNHLDIAKKLTAYLSNGDE